MNLKAFDTGYNYGKELVDGGTSKAKKTVVKETTS